MCKIDKILKTTIRDYNQGEAVGKRMTKQRIRYNTDVVFAVAKRMELPLDKTAEMMVEKDMFKRLKRFYTRRDSVSVATVGKEISLSL